MVKLLIYDKLMLCNEILYIYIYIFVENTKKCWLNYKTYVMMMALCDIKL